MKIVQLTPGAGGMYCGSCMRDNAMVASLRALGHDPLLIPLYTPLTTDETDNSGSRIFFGGLNVFLQQKLAMFRNTPEWIDNRLDHPDLLRFATRFGIKTEPQQLGELTVSMLKGEDGRQSKEVEKLLVFLRDTCKPDIVSLSNVLLTGVARRIRNELKVPVVCTLQGEDFFLDGLPEPQRSEAWAILQDRAADFDAVIAVSNYYGDVMRERLKLRPERVNVVHNGINLDGYAPAPHRPAEPTVGFLARLAPEKGLRVLVDAFKILRERIPNAKLRIAGSMTGGDAEFVNEIRKRISDGGMEKDVTILPNLAREEKIKFLQSCSVLSVPAAYGESFGLYVLEALACCVPVVQPDHAAFPELLQAVGGGILCRPGDPADLAQKLDELLRNEARCVELGRAGRQRVRESYTIERMSRDVVGVFEKAIAAYKRGAQS